jgi:hypothetical protein
MNVSRVIDSLSTINSFVRTLLALVVVGGVGTVGYLAYTNVNSNQLAIETKEKQLREKQQELTDARSELADAEQQVGHLRGELDSVTQSLQSTQKTLEQTRLELGQKSKLLAEREQEIVALNQDLEAKQLELEQLAAAMRLLKVNHRVARLAVLQQETDPDTNDLYSTIEFVELDDNGKPIEEPKEFRIKGDVVYIDNWVVKFEDKYVEQAELDRATSLVLFRRIFGEFQEPSDGFRLDEVGERPEVYAQGTDITPFEKRIWDDFWNIANDEAKARSMGIRAAHGEAPSIRVQDGKSYRVLLRASDGLSIKPEP